jgi:zinc protease
MTNNYNRIQPQVIPAENIIIPDAASFKLDNGIPVFFLEAGTEDIMRLEFTFRSGQVFEKQPLQASTTNRMLTEGSLNYSSEELNRVLDFNGIFVNLSCEKDNAGIVLYFLNKHIERALDLSHEILFCPLFPENELNSLMKKRLNWFQVNIEKVQNQAQDQFFESLFGSNHPYGRKVSVDDFQKITPELLKEFHSKFYSPGNMAIIASGKIHERTLTILNNNFGGIHFNNVPVKDVPVLKNGQGKRKIFIKKSGAVQSAIKIGSTTINKKEPDYPALKVLDTILGGYFGSRLMKNIREDKGYTYGINSVVTSLGLTGYKSITTEVGNSNREKAISEIYKEIKILQDTYVEKNELEVVRNYMSGEMLRMFDGPFALAESFKSAWEFGLDNNYYYRLAEKIKTIESDEIRSLALTYYRPEDLFEITVGEE